MEFQCSPLSWEFCYQEEGLEDLKHSFLCTTLELEATIASAKEEITKRECELFQVNDLLSKVIKERDEAQAKCQKLMQEKLDLQQQLQQKQQLVQQSQNHQQQQQQPPRDTAAATTTTISQNNNEDEISEKHYSAPATASASSDCEENSMASAPTTSLLLEVAMELAEKKPLPEKGNLLKAVVEAGPLLQTLLLAGPLPQWQHPPPQLNAIEIPPVAISSPKVVSDKSFSFRDKRDLVLFSSSSSGVECPVSKCRKFIHHSPTTPTTPSPKSLPHPLLFS